MRRKRSRPPKGGLWGVLRKAVLDRYVRKRPKKARNWLHKKKEKPPGTPNIRIAEKAEVQKAQQLREPNQWK